VVRTRNIFRKAAEQQPDFRAEALDQPVDAAAITELLKGPAGDDVWGLVLLAGSLDYTVSAAVAVQEPAFVAKYAFELSQAFNLFYHHHHILSEEDQGKKMFLLRLSKLVERQLVTALGLLGIIAPQKM